MKLYNLLVYRNDIVILENFTYLRSVMQNNIGSRRTMKVLSKSLFGGLTWHMVMDSSSMNIFCC